MNILKISHLYDTPQEILTTELANISNEAEPCDSRPRDIPMFPIQIWYVCDHTLALLPRTNNNVEGWHKRFQTTCGCAT